ncbi:MAG: hypothetical protein HYW47_05290 [Deltaproteobacteria bacterium]|nr:hypothetical protein [Deltaproteobacteria bacterium]
MRFSIIDLGTNSVRIDVYEMNQKKIFQLLRERVMIRLGEGLFQKKYITKNVMQRTLHTFEDFSDILYEFKVERVIAVGTSAMRVATNAQRLKKIIHKETGIQLKIISGLKEAELIAQGILSYEKMPQGFSLLVDIGGGSTEISLSRGHELFFATSLNLGAHRLHQLFLKRNPPLKKNAIDILRSYIY